MIIQVEYDDKGDIKSVAIPASITFPDGSKGAMRRIRASGHEIAEVETELVRNDRDIDGLRKVKDGYRVIGHPQNPTLATHQARA
jgi:hypothetical protein